MKTTLNLKELAAAAGVSARTIRYYVQRGLLPAPAFHGRDTTYSHDHLHRLAAIKKLQDHFLPLDAIAAELERAGAESILARKAPRENERPAPPTAKASATPATLSRFVLAPGLELLPSKRRRCRGTRARPLPSSTLPHKGSAT